MAQWGQGQQGFQYPQQTGFPGQQQFQQQQPQQFQQQPQQFQQPLQGQPTGFPGQGFGGGLQLQPTGFPGAQGFQQPLQAQATGFPGGGLSPMQRRAPPPVPPMPPRSAFGGGLAPQPTGFPGMGMGGGLQPQPTGFPGGGGLQPQPTGFPGAGGGMAPLMPQMTGFIDPRLQMMSSSFMPTNLSNPYAGGALQLPSVQQPLQQSFQQMNQETRGTAAPRVPWTLSKGEKKSYDQIFRAWDSANTGFIDGKNALEVFGQSGLDRNDLAQIWSLADADNRGKLNLAEFHVAMALIYRRLNGNEIPNVLPPELVPPSHRDLETSVNFLKSVLGPESRPSPSNDGLMSRKPERSLFGSGAGGAGTRHDATVYRHSDDNVEVYTPSSRHGLDRSAVRTGREGAADDLSEMKRQLQNTADMLDKATAESRSRTAEDDALDRELADLRYRVKRVQEDLDYVSRGPRTTGKDEERRKLERQLMQLLHERVPEVERKIEERERRREREKRDEWKERDTRNDRSGRYDDRDDRYENDRRDRDRDGGDRSYSRQGDRDYDRDRDRGYNDRYDRDRLHRDYDRDDRDRDYGRRSPAPPPPAAPESSISKPPPAPPVPTASPAPKAKLTPAERQAEAQRRIQERMRALGVTAPGTPAPVDNGVEERLAQEKKEAEERARKAEEEAAERERTRKERLENERAMKEGRNTPAPATPIAEAPRAPAPPPAPAARKPSAPPPPAKRAPAPPAPRKPTAPPPRASPAVSTPPASSFVAPPPPPAPEVDPAEEALRAREEALRKKREEREARMRELEREEEEEARRVEEEFKKRQAERLQRAASPAPPPPPPPAPPVASPPTESVVTSPASLGKTSHNPFNRLGQSGAGPAASTPTGASGMGGTNPFFKNQANGGAAPPAAPPSAPAAPPPPPAPAVQPPAARAPSVPPPSRSPAPRTYQVAGDASDTSDWGKEKDDDDSDSDSEDEFTKSRFVRQNLAQQLFSGMLPSTPISRPASAAPDKMSAPAPPPAPPAPPAPAPAVPVDGGAAPPALPPPPFGAPAPPPPPPAPTAAALPPAAAGDRGALLGSILGGAKLKKAKTNDRSGAAVAGAVVGDAAPPEHIINAPRAPSPPVESAGVAGAVSDVAEAVGNKWRQSVDWVSGMAADAASVLPAAVNPMPAFKEEDEDVEEPKAAVPDIQVSHDEPDAMQDIDRTVQYRVRSLFPYQGQRAEDLTFGENLVLTVHPSKTGGDWWYGTVVRDQKSGFFPNTYVQKVNPVNAVALYSYNGENADELPFTEGDTLSIVDHDDADWWKAEKEGVVFIVPAAYLEIHEGLDAASNPTTRSAPAEVGPEIAQPLTAAVPPSVSVPETEHEGVVSVQPPSNHPTDDSDSDDEADYMSFSSSEDGEDGEDQATRLAREHERQRVLEAAGLIVKSDRQPPPRPPKRDKAKRTRRAPPPAPNVERPSSADVAAKELPALPEEVIEPAARLNDAFERYEAFKMNKDSNRLSIASTEALTASPTSPVHQERPVSTDGEVRARTHTGFFSNLLGRKTPANDEKRPSLVISGPMISGPVSANSEGPARMDSPAFGSSWASLVDRNALEGMPTKERKRQEAIFELIATEAAYVRDLQLIVEVFYSSMIPLLDSKAVTVIFANVEDILLANTTFLSSLEERQKECRLYIDKIGDILQTYIGHMHIYMEYCVNQGPAIKVLQSLRESNPTLASHLQRLREDPAVRNLDLSSYLLVPMQRLTRYPLLIRQILSYSEVDSDRSPIESSLATAEKILSRINESIRDQEGREMLKSISQNLWIGQGRLDLTEPTRYMGSRKLLREGIVTKAKSRRKLHVFLCSDILVLTDEGVKSLYRMPIPLSGMEVREAGGNRDDTVFEVAVVYPRGGDAVALRCLSARDCHLWMQALDQAIQRCREAEKGAQRVSRRK